MHVAVVLERGMTVEQSNISVDTDERKVYKRGKRLSLAPLFLCQDKETKHREVRVVGMTRKSHTLEVSRSSWRTHKRETL